jgi:hypothetical protein
MFAINAMLSSGAEAPKTLNYLGNDGASSSSFTGCDLGTPAADRRIIVWASTDGGNADRITGITVAGEACDMLVENTGRGTCAIGIAIVPTGTSGTISITATGTARYAIGWWECTGLSDNTAHDTATTDTDNDPMSLDTTDGGFLVGGGCHENSALPSTTGDATERWSSSVSGELGNSGGDATTDGTSTDITIDGISNSRRGACAVSF